MSNRYTDRLTTLVFLSVRPLFFLFLPLFSGEQWPYGTIHIIGDSNAPYSFTNQYDVLPSLNIPAKGTSEWITYEQCFFDNALSTSNHLEIPCAIHWVQGRTMHRIGRDGIDGLNIQTYQVNDRDVAVFHFGAIDQGGHIYKQVIKGRELDEIIDTLVSTYLRTIQENQKMYPDLTVVIQAVIPPRINADPFFVDDFHKGCPYVNFLDFQSNVTHTLNTKLEMVSKQHNFLFLNVNELLETKEGGLREDLSDGSHHVHPKYNFLFKEKLILLLLDHYRLKMKQTLS